MSLDDCPVLGILQRASNFSNTSPSPTARMVVITSPSKSGWRSAGPHQTERYRQSSIPLFVHARAPHRGGKKLQPFRHRRCRSCSKSGRQTCAGPAHASAMTATRSALTFCGSASRILNRKGCGLVELAAVERRSCILGIRWLQIAARPGSLSKHGVLSMAFYAKRYDRAPDCESTWSLNLNSSKSDPNCRLCSTALFRIFVSKHANAWP